jgi:hypothetical protein
MATTDRDFTCDLCGKTYEKEVSDAEMDAEYRERFAAAHAMNAERAVVCDDCWKLMGLEHVQ